MAAKNGTSKRKIAAPAVADSATIRNSHVDRPQFNPNAVSTVAHWVAANRSHDAKYEADSVPTSYGNGCNDGSALAEEALLELANGIEAGSQRLSEYLFEDQHTPKNAGDEEEDLDYRRGLVVGYVSVLHDYIGSCAKNGIDASTDKGSTS